MRPGRELSGSTRERQDLEQCCWALELEAAWVSDLPEHRYLWTVHFLDDHRDLDVWDVGRKLPGQNDPQLHRREPRGLDVVHERQRNLAVGSNRNLAAQMLVFPHIDLDHVFRPQRVLERKSLQAGLFQRGGRTAARAQSQTNRGQQGQKSNSRVFRSMVNHQKVTGLGTVRVRPTRTRLCRTETSGAPGVPPGTSCQLN